MRCSNLKVDSGRRLAPGQQGTGPFLGVPASCSGNQTPTIEEARMSRQFTHRQGAVSSHTSICMRCFRVVATRERESELRSDEANHSCKISLPGTKPDPTYWGVLCRS